MTVLERIEQLRAARGWSINYLAMEAMLTQSTLSNLYTREAEPKLSTLRALCGAFGISIADFFAGMEEEGAADGVDEELKNRIAALSKEEKEALLVLLRGNKNF